MSQSMCILVLSGSFSSALVCWVSLGSAGLGHGIIILACVLVVYSNCIYVYFVLCFCPCIF